MTQNINLQKLSMSHENTKLCVAFGVVISFFRLVAFSIRHQTYSCSLNNIVDVSSVIVNVLV